MLERNVKGGRTAPAMFVGGALLAVLCLAAGYGWYVRSITRGPDGGASAPANAPTEAEYDAAAAEAAGPFLRQALAFDADAGAAADLAADAAGVKEQVLGLRLPADRRGAHLELVLLLDQWERAGKDPSLAEAAKARTVELTTTYPWLLP